MLVRFGDNESGKCRNIKEVKIPGQNQGFESAFSWFVEKYYEDKPEEKERITNSPIVEKELCLLEDLNLFDNSDPERFIRMCEEKYKSLDDIQSSIMENATRPTILMKDVEKAVDYNCGYERSKDKFLEYYDFEIPHESENIKNSYVDYYNSIAIRLGTTVLPMEKEELIKDFCRVSKYLLFWRDYQRGTKATNCVLNQLYGGLYSEDGKEIREGNYNKGRSLRALQEAFQNDLSIACDENDRWLFEKLTGIGAVLNLFRTACKYYRNPEVVQILLDFSDELFRCKPVFIRMRLSELLGLIIDSLLIIDPNKEDSDNLFNVQTVTTIKRTLKEAIDKANDQYFFILKNMLNAIKNKSVAKPETGLRCIVVKEGSNEDRLVPKVKLVKKNIVNQREEDLCTTAIRGSLGEAQIGVRGEFRDLMLNSFGYDEAVKKILFASQKSNSTTRRAVAEEASFVKLLTNAIRVILKDYDMVGEGGVLLMSK